MELKPDPIFTELKAILDSRDIRTVFQPIVCLKTGSILGFEALSRGPAGSALESPVELFAAAEKYNLLFALEKLCREKALTNAKGIMDGYKIFINVNPIFVFDVVCPCIVLGTISPRYPKTIIFIQHHDA